MYSRFAVRVDVALNSWDNRDSMENESSIVKPPPAQIVGATGAVLIRSIVACLVGTLILRTASSVTGNMLQLYFGYIDTNEYPIPFTLRGILTALFFLPELLASPVLGSLSDRYGRKLFIMIGPITGAIAVQLTALTSSFGILAFTRLLEGTSTASAIPATLGYLAAGTSEDESLRGRVMGIFEISTIGGTLLGLLIAGPLWDTFQRHAFTLNGLIYILSLVVFFFGIVEVRERLNLSGINLRDGLRDEFTAAGEIIRQAFSRIQVGLTSPKILRFAPAWLALNMILGAWLNGTVGQLVETSDRFPDQFLYGLFSDSARQGTQISFYGAGILLVFGLGVLLWSFTFGRFKRTTVMLIGASGIFVMTFFVYLLNHAGSFSNPLLPLYVLGALVGLVIVSGFTPAALTYLADVTEDDPGDRGAIMGLYTVFFGVGQFFGTLLSGPFADFRGFDGMLLLTLILGAFATVLLLRLKSGEQRA